MVPVLDPEVISVDSSNDQTWNNSAVSQNVSNNSCLVDTSFFMLLLVV